MNDIDPRSDELTLALLNTIQERSDVSQRHLAANLGIALGLANAYIKRCARKGYVKVKEVPANRYLYFLTPKGFAEKSRLTARFLSSSLQFYRRAAESCDAVFDTCERRALRRVVLCGGSDLAEIALTRAVAYKIEVVGLYDPSCPTSHLFSVPVRRHWKDAADGEAFVITSLNDPLPLYRAVKAFVGASDRVLVPLVLGLDRNASIQTR